MPSHSETATINTSTQIDDLIGIAPNWLLRSGISLVALVTLVVLLVTAFIRYPDKLVAKGIMTSAYPPVEYVNSFRGIIDTIYCNNGTVVQEDDPLVYFKNNTLLADVKRIEQFIQQYASATSLSSYVDLNFPQHLQLGDLQNSYNQLNLAFAEFQRNLHQVGVFQQIRTLKKEIADTRTLRSVLLKEKNFSKEEMVLIERDLNRNTTLKQEGVVSAADLEKAEGQWIQYKKQYSNLDQGIIRNKIREQQLILEVQKLTEERAAVIQSLQHTTEQYINTLQAEIKEWDKRYFVRAQIDGSVAWNASVASKQFVEQSTSLLSIIPTVANNKKMVLAQTANAGVGKIEVTDKVIVKVDGYPYKEFGAITSEVTQIDALPQVIQTNTGERQQQYNLTVNLPDTLITNYHQNIDFKPNSAVTIEVITKDKSLLERLLETFLSLIQTN